jgi:hypothetical protein
MDKYVDIFSNLILFLVVAIIFLVVLSIFMFIFLRNFKVDEKKIKIYGLFLNMDNKSLIAFSALSLNYLFLVWCMVSFNDINVIYVFVTYMLVFISDIVRKNYPKGFINLILSGVNCLAIHIVYVVHNYLIEQYQNPILIVVLVLTLIFIFMYYTYNLFRSLNDVIIQNKYLDKRGKYQV